MHLLYTLRLAVRVSRGPFGGNLRTLVLAPLLFFGAAPGCAGTGVLLQGFYWDVPSPAAGRPDSTWWWDHLAEQASRFCDIGFTAIWLPPELKGASGGHSVGYDPFDDYDLGSKHQRGTLATHYGTREQLERCCAVMRANGLDLYADVVDNHRDGDSGDGDFHYLDASGRPGAGRFPKQKADFHPAAPQDPGVPLGSEEDFGAFGRDLAPVTSGYLVEDHRLWGGLEDAVEWQSRALDVQGYRFDYVKGISTYWLRDLLARRSLVGRFAVGEYYDTDIVKVRAWVAHAPEDSPTGVQGRMSAFDFPLRDRLKNMCNRPDAFDMSTLEHAGLAGVDPTHAVTFVENHDTDRGDPIITRKALAYAFILTSEGYPSVFYKDWSSEPGCYHMSSAIDRLVWIHAAIARGPTVVRSKGRTIFVFERTGTEGRGRLLVGLSSNTTDEATVTCATGFAPKTLLHDYAGHEPDIYTDAASRVTIRIPVNRDGESYVCYAPPGYTTPPRRRVRSTTQEYAGAEDLDIPAADSNLDAIVCRVYGCEGTVLAAALRFDTSFWTPATHLALTVFDPSGRKIATHHYNRASSQISELRGRASTTGWYTFKIRAFQPPVLNPRPAFWLSITYTAPTTLAAKLKSGGSSRGQQVTYRGAGTP